MKLTHTVCVTGVRAQGCAQEVLGTLPEKHGQGSCLFSVPCLATEVWF
jgi:hypothetical protein